MAQEKICGVYKIENLITGYVYIGSSVDIIGRFNSHKYYLRNGKHCSKEFQLDFNKHGEDSFKFVVIEKCQNNISKTDLEKREQYYLNNTQLKYNLSPTAGSNLGYKHSENTCLNMSLSSCMLGKLGKDNPYAKPVYQYNLEGEFVKKWYGYYEIERELGFGIHHIYTAIKRNGTSFGFIWFRDYQGEKIKSRKISDMTKRCRRIGMFDRNENLIRVFNSRKEVSSCFNWKSCKSFKYILSHIPEKFKEYNFKEISHEEYNQNIHLTFQPEKN